ncbi:NMDA receptor synaptonuclear signaling and neuronal migration factor isoform X2 [Lepisosteus oculatus]|uniref:NMDA receptor synaptonuclear signaling and neuronal migration factor isoform X2 n=1 Tax=Lepisosteus oculatus TaxID=7918 RepID=UPI003712C9E5
MRRVRRPLAVSWAGIGRAARAFGEYLSHAHPENRNGSDHLLSETFICQDSDSLENSGLHNNNNNQRPAAPPRSPPAPGAPAGQDAPAAAGAASCPPNKRRLSLVSGGQLERSLSAEEPPPPALRGLCADCEPQPPRVYTITREGGMLGGRGSAESLELEVLKGSQELGRRSPPSPPPAAAGAPPHGGEGHHHHGNHHHGGHHHGNHHHHHHHHHQQQHANSGGGGGAPPAPQPLQSSGSAHNIRGWAGAGSRPGSRDCPQDCAGSHPAPVGAQHSLDLESARQRKKLERMYSVDRVSEDVPIHSWFPKENMFSFQTATTTMQAAFRGFAERKRRKREHESAAVIQRNFRKHLRMVGSRRMRAQTFADRREKSFSRSWSDPTPIKTDPLHDSRDSGDLQESCGTLDEGSADQIWEEEREEERLACQGEDFIPPKIMLISSKVPKAEYVPNIIRRDDHSIIPILYDHEHATFDDILEEIEKKLNAYRRGCKIWRMLIFCQGGPGHLYLLKNKVATFAKVEKEEDMILFWKRLSRLMTKLNPEPNVIHVMGCYVLGNPNGEKLFQNLKNLMKPQSITFESPLELSAQGKEMIETYFDFRLYRLWKTRQHSKLLDYDDIL